MVRRMYLPRLQQALRERVAQGMAGYALGEPWMLGSAFNRRLHSRFKDMPSPRLARVGVVSLKMSLTRFEFALNYLVRDKEDKVRLGIDKPKKNSVHRLEVYQAIRREKPRGGSDPEDGPAGSRVARPASPKPPSLAKTLNGRARDLL